jgi:hexosaminidase
MRKGSEMIYKKKELRFDLIVVFSILLLVLSCQAAKKSDKALPQLHLMPWPAQIALESGKLRIPSGFRVVWEGYREPRLLGAVERFDQRIKGLTGISQSSAIGPDTVAHPLEIRCSDTGEEIQSLREDESYSLHVGSSRVVLQAPTPVGILRGLATLFQLIDKDDEGLFMPAVRIQDKPRFPWRGLLIDVCRHWMPIDVIKRNLDGMAAVKLNVLHWHLSEDQGFRVECMNFPRLHEMGSDGDYYTQQQVRDVIDYARDRGIRVVPEFDMPGHTTSWFVGYPELASGPGPLAIERHWGVFDPCMDPTREEVYAFLDTFIGEMTLLFPDDYFHIGGDEVNGNLWNSNPDITAFKKEQSMKDNHDLQAYFNKKISGIIQKHGKKMIGWDEIFHPELPKDVVVHSWRGPESLAETARQGYMGILSNGYYLDHILSAAQHYQVEPLSGDAAVLSVEERDRILGGEACMWAEFITPETIDSRIWPRAAAVAERFWSPQGMTDKDNMYRRLEVLNENLDSLGLQHNTNYPVMLQRLAGEHPIDSLKILADIVEPVKYYTRPGTREYTQMTPLIRLVDAARPESQQARKFRDMVDGYLADAPEFKTNRDMLREWLSKWRDNHKELKPILEDSPMLQEIIPLSEDTAALAEAGFQAMEYIEKDQEAPLSLVDKVLPLLNPPQRPEHELLIMIAPGIEKLIQKARPPLATDDFEDDDSLGWEPNVPENWQIGGEKGARFYQLTAPGTPGEIRAPASWSLLKEQDVSSFIFTGSLRCASPVDNPHRDMVIVFHYQDPTHFYYVHFSAVSDELHNIIGLVNGADRVRISRESPGGSTARLTDMRFHGFKVSCNGETGEIKAYCDDMQTPILTAQDKTLGHGLVGVGSFDDTGSFDAIRLWGDKYE